MWCVKHTPDALSVLKLDLAYAVLGSEIIPEKFDCLHYLYSQTIKDWVLPDLLSLAVWLVIRSLDLAAVTHLVSAQEASGGTGGPPATSASLCSCCHPSAVGAAASGAHHHVVPDHRGFGRHPGHHPLQGFTQVGKRRVGEVVVGIVKVKYERSDDYSQRKYVLDRPSKFPPGPINFPLFGSLLKVDVRNLSKSFKKLSRKWVGCLSAFRNVFNLRYGDVFSIFVGRTPVVVINSYDLIKTTLERWADIFLPLLTFNQDWVFWKAR